MATSLCHHRLDHISGPTHAHNTIARRRKYHACGWLVSMLYHGRAYTGTRISTGCPSTTPVGLALGPDSPWEDELDPGTLGHPVDGFLTRLSLLMPAFSLAHPPRLLTVSLQPMHDAPLPNIQKYIAAASAVCLSPTTLSAQNHSTSELLRTLSRMAASKPTSWLSSRSYILFHLAHP